MTPYSASRRASRPPPFKRAVPPAVRYALEAALRVNGGRDRQALARIYRSFQLGKRYGVTLRQLETYVRTMPTERTADAPESGGAAPEAGCEAYPAASSFKTAAFRAQMRAYGTVVATMARALEDCDPVEWGRGAYFALMGSVFDVLTGERSDLEPKDLALLSKVIAEQRTAETRASGSRRAETGTGCSAHQPSAAPSSVERLEELARQLYGTNLQRDVEPDDAEPARSAGPASQPEAR